MRFFALLNFQHVAALIIIAIIFLILFTVGLALIPMSGPRRKAFDVKAVQFFADGIQKGNGPFPLIIALLIAGTILWAVFYILYYGFSEVLL